MRRNATVMHRAVKELTDWRILRVKHMQCVSAGCCCSSVAGRCRYIARCHKKWRLRQRQTVSIAACSWTFLLVFTFAKYGDGGSGLSTRTVQSYSPDVYTPRIVKRVELRHHAKLRGDRSYCCRDMAIFHFLKMAAATVFDF